MKISNDLGFSNLTISLLNSKCVGVALFVFLLLFPTLLFAQQNVTCPSCDGTKGMQTMAGFMPCFQCLGSGTVVDPSYAMKQSEKRGFAAGLLARGRIELSEGNYDKAFDAFKKSYNNDNKEAIAFLAVCYELGMGTAVDKDHAFELYSYGKRLDMKDCAAAVDRINKAGFWAANNTMRENFSQLVKSTMSVPGGGPMPVPGGDHRPSPVSGRTCPSCNGSGYGFDKITYSPNFTGQDNSRYCNICERKMSAHSHHKPVCRSCKGRKTVN